MRLYFKDNNGDVRAVDGEFSIGVESQSKLQSHIKAGTDLKPQLPILEAVEPGKFGKKENQNEPELVDSG